MTIIECVCSDAAIRRRRLEARVRLVVDSAISRFEPARSAALGDVL